MKLGVTSIVPVELFTRQRCAEFVTGLERDEMVAPVVGGQSLAPVVSELCGADSRVFSLLARAHPFAAEMDAFLVQQESSLCVVVRLDKAGWKPTEASIRHELLERNEWHRSLITGQGGGAAGSIVRDLVNRQCSDGFPSPSVAYVFSFYTVAREAGDGDESSLLDLLKLLAEPSLVDLDDMLSTVHNDTPEESGAIKDRFRKGIEDCDMACGAQTFVTWATVVSATSDSEFVRTRDLITALECRLQAVWNRCFSVSTYIDDVFDGIAVPNDVSSLYWSFARTLDDAKAVISSTFSTRANHLFGEMIVTSRLSGEIDRLAEKVNLLDKYVEQRNQREARVYQKTIELLLFATALFSMIQVLFPMPLTIIPQASAAVLLGAVAAIGALAIFKAR